MVGAIAIKDRIDGEVSHPDGAIVVGCLQPFECVFVAVQRCVDLSQSVGRNVTLPPPVLIRQELLSNFLRSFRFADRSPRIVVRWRRVEVSGLIERCYSATAVGKLAALRLP